MSVILSRRRLLATAGASCALGLCGCAQSPATGRTFLGTGSIEDDVKTGQQEHAKLVKSFGGVYEDRKLQSYVEKVGKKLAETSEAPNLPYTFTIANSPIVNAFALPGGPVTITRGLLALCNSEAEMAGVLGHEIGHITARHTAERQGQSMLAQLGVAALAVATGSNQLASLAGQGAQAWLLSYSRSQESEADALGARYLERTNYDVDKMVTFLDALHDYSVVEGRMAGLPEGQVDEFNMMATHPRTVDRVRDAMKIAAVAQQSNPLINREIYLNEINGLMFGDDPKEGTIQGRRFAHRDMRLEFIVPEGFRLTNSDKNVTARHSSGASIVFDVASNRYGEPMAYLTQGWARGASLSNLRSLMVNGMDAAAASTRGRVGNTNVSVDLVALRKDNDEVYRLLFLTPLGQAAALEEDYRQMLNSFRRLSTAEAASLKPLRLIITYVRKGETPDSLSREMPFGSFNDDWFRLLNQLPDRATLSAGQVVKMVQARS